MQKDTHPLGLVSADQMFKSKCKKRKHASNLCLQIKCSNAADQGVRIYIAQSTPSSDHEFLKPDKT